MRVQLVQRIALGTLYPDVVEMVRRARKRAVYQVKATDARMVAIPSLILFAAAFLAAVPAAIRAVRIDPVEMLRAE